MTVGIAGWYHRGNFGDDLMAMMIARELTKKGWDVVLWGIDEEEASNWGATSIQKEEKFLSEIDVLVFGGGGLLANAQVEDDFDSFLRVLVEEATSRGIPIHGISLGGDGSLGSETISPGRKALLENISLLTVRNPQDVEDTAEFGVDASFHHDIVWQCGRYLEEFDSSTETHGGSKNILVNIEEKSAPRKTFILLTGLLRILPSFRVEHLNIVRSMEDFHRLQKQLHHYGIVRYSAYSSVQSCLARIKRADAVVSSKMHIGMCSLASGSKFLSVFGEEKTRIMMENIGIEEFFVGKRPGKLLRATKALCRSESPGAFEKQKRDARNHLDALIDVLQN